MWAVAAWGGRSKGAAHPWTEEEFDALGRSDWADFRAAWEQFGLTRGTLVELGCGAGRLTNWIAADFDRVVGTDVSPDMLAFGASRVRAGNVELRRTDGRKIPAEDACADAVFSVHVFQHLDRREHVLPIFEEILRVLRPRGTFFVHLPVVLWPPEFRFDAMEYRLWLWRERIRRWRARRSRARIAKGEPRPLMRMTGYEYTWLRSNLVGMGFEGVEMRVVHVRSNDGAHTVMLGRKRVAPGTGVRS
jgi:SAM-dependent methyltransferase